MTTTKITPFGSILSCMAALILVTTWNLWALFSDPAHQDLFFGVGIAVAITFLVWSIHLSTVGTMRRYSFAFLLLCFSNVVDELFFDPTARDVNEYIAASLIVLLAVFYNRIHNFNMRIVLFLRRIIEMLNKYCERCRKKIGLHTL
jgi:uncharacterized membrane protein